MNVSKNSGVYEGPVAWEAPGTARALVRWVALQVSKIVGWSALWWALVAITVVMLPVWAAAFMTLPLAVTGYLVAMAVRRLKKVWLLRRILTVYPWQQQPDAVRLKGKSAVFVLPDPDRPEKTVSPKEPGNLLKLWDRVARKGFQEELWYAGDPRFACVVARPGLKSLSYVVDSAAWHPRSSPRRKGVSPEARRRARAIGARVAD
ncbi:hypothetical protein ACWEWI_38265 [Streptomyces sp. NPDC003753]|uniref:hypothetical protein n=1 Tax=Streptomyces sp. Y2F8-2 TaxID=2759675 RepID=UPI001904DB66|nr:hypothetical protein [Streptomyces sp. Y2F8-2]GHK04779.1 hypothetical protein SY2F82_65760 [Streptomyces sp. Y2F8-2]